MNKNNKTVLALIAAVGIAFCVSLKPLPDATEEAPVIQEQVFTTEAAMGSAEAEKREVRQPKIMYTPIEIPYVDYEAVIAECSAPREPERELTYLGRYYITGYDLCVQCCGKTDGITKSGVPATVGRTIAIKGLDFGTELYIDGLGERVVEDRGPVSGEIIDVLCNDHAECYAITGWRDVYLYNKTTD